jgi:hypothetical protein
MRKLQPLTISKSIKDAPTVLLTPELEKFLFVRPLTKELLLAQAIYATIYHHFKVKIVPVGSFQMNGANYLCSKQFEGICQVEDWVDYLWTSKRSFKRLLNPQDLFQMYLIDLYFPVFKKTNKLLVADKKDRFIMEGYPQIEEQGIVFQPSHVHKIGLNQAAFKRLFRFNKHKLILQLEEFETIHHQKLYSDLKYQISLYPEIRNQYWDELKKCFDQTYRTFVYAEVKNYLLKL